MTVAFLNSGFVVGAAQGHDFRIDLRRSIILLQEPATPGEPAISALERPSSRVQDDAEGLESLVDECTGVSKPANARTDLQKQNLANILGVMRFSERSWCATCRRRRSSSARSPSARRRDAMRSRT